MIDIVLLLGIVAAFSFTITFFGLTFENPPIKTKWYKIYLFILIILVWWGVQSGQEEWRINKELVTTSSTVNSVQLVTFVDDDDTYVYNLNKMFGRTFEDGQDFKLIFRDEGPYFGVWYVMSKLSKLEVVE